MAGLTREGRQRLEEIATAVRRFLEEVWPAWHAARGEAPAVPSRWTCGRSSLFLLRVLDEQGLPGRWVSGTPRLGEGQPEIGPYGFFDGRQWHAHAWVRLGDSIVDVTADQFGAAPVLVVAASDPRYGEGTGDTALPAFAAARERAAAELMPRWRASPERARLGAGD
ncbi:lasso peptide biosynthesis protein [Ancylobacter oerskovii]|uniref:Lasso peptide biosynthesis protein n=1 Tax=Ancylobacter oerskovii TaxID=459519 RepID=A0ABW4Z0K8_9HYPH|nr:lasso peptide biosynthesis protein [Ancylobacter oerskovii]MBS7542662.1 lasso peptide biosynthesis protein [Ancylobacter oerskovii]